MRWAYRPFSRALDTPSYLLPKVQPSPELVP